MLMQEVFLERRLLKSNVSYAQNYGTEIYIVEAKAGRGCLQLHVRTPAHSAAAPHMTALFSFLDTEE